MEQELKPCPFCGNGRITLHGSDKFYYAICHRDEGGCEAIGPSGVTNEAAANKWNRHAEMKPAAKTTEIVSDKPPFWLVWARMGDVPEESPSEKEALDKAEFLTRCYPDRPFYVLIPVAEARVETVKVTRYRHAEGTP